MLQAGFARIDITPPLGDYMSGYYNARNADGILDPLLASCLALRDGDSTAVVFSLDLIGIPQSHGDICRQVIAEANGLPVEAVFYACTHTHTGPVLSTKLFPENPMYNEILYRRLATAAAMAIADLHDAELRVARGSAPGISFVRRFRMKDGNIRTNPGVGNPEIREPIGRPDETVQLVRILRSGAPEIVLVNFQVHPDVIGGCQYSADYPKFVRDTMEGALGEGVRCMYFNGAQGDTNHIDVGIAPTKSPNKSIPGRGYTHSRHMGRVIAGGALQVYSKAEPVDAQGLRFGFTDCVTELNKPTPEELARALEIVALHEAGREKELPETGMGITTLVAEAYRMQRMAQAPDTAALRVGVVGFGQVAIAGIPGEPFTDIGRGIKDASPFAMTIPCCCANGYEGYYPTYMAFAEGGYEARSSSYLPGVAEKLIQSSVELLRRIY